MTDIKANTEKKAKVGRPKKVKDAKEENVSRWWTSEAYRQHQYNYYSQVIECELCKCKYSRSHKKKHLETKQHKKLLELKNELLEKVKAKLENIN